MEKMNKQQAFDKAAHEGLSAEVLADVDEASLPEVTS